VRFAALTASVEIAVVAQHAQAEAGCGAPRPAEDGWPVAEPETVDLDGATLCSMSTWLRGWKEGNIHAVLVVRSGALVFEQYFSGNDEHWGRAVGEVDFGPAARRDERSLTKSVVALVLGIAIDRGWVKSIDEPVLSFFPQYSDLRTPDKDRITLRHLLTMPAGLEWHEYGVTYTNPANSQTLMDSARDPYRYVLEQKVVNRRGHCRSAAEPPATITSRRPVASTVPAPGRAARPPAAPPMSRRGTSRNCPVTRWRRPAAQQSLLHRAALRSASRRDWRRR
jgi:hypothetical protein